MATTLVWSGLEELHAALRELPAACAAEALKLNEGGVNRAYLQIAQVYEAHKHTGTLRKRLTITSVHGGFVLKSGSPIAWLFDNGSQARHWASGKSTGKMWGKTPPTHIFTRTIGQERRRLVDLFREMLIRHGATTVTGE